MSDPIALWLIRTALGGGVLLLAGWLLARRGASPARRQRLGEWAAAAALVVALLGLAPAWLLLPAPGWLAPVPAAAVPPPAESEPASPEWVFAPEPADVIAIPTPTPEAATPAVPAAERSAWAVRDVILLLYAAAALILAGRWALGHAVVWWMLRRREPVPAHVAGLFAELTGGRAWRLVVSPRAPLPFSVGLWRPTVVLPARLARDGGEQELRWVLTHEVAHLRRHDTRTGWLFALGQVVYFYLPWFWWLRRQVRLCQEFVADATAARAAGCPADYAQFLVRWAGRPPATATGVSGSHSDLFRRVAMLLTSSAPEARCPRRWAAVGAGLLSFAVLAGGLGWQARADEKKSEPPKQDRKQEPKKQKARPAPNLPGMALPNVEKLLEQLGGFDDEALRRQMDEMRQRLEELRKRAGRPGLAFPNLPNAAWPRLDRAAPGNARLGAQVSSPSPTLADQLDLPKGHGLVLEEVGANSAAAKAGLKRHDILLELAGKPVPSKVDAFAKLLDGVEANKPVEVVVLRKGKKETVRGLTLPERPAAAAVPALPILPNVPNLRLRPNLLGGGAVTSITRNNDEFTARQQSGGATIIVTGKVVQGRAVVSQVEVQANGQTNRYDSLDKVPAEYRDRARRLVDAAGDKGVRLPRVDPKDEV